jgi:type III pantothenate kinase
MLAVFASLAYTKPMMISDNTVLLCADIGNSAIKLALVSALSGNILSEYRCRHRQLIAGDGTEPEWPQFDYSQELIGISLASVSNQAQTQVWLDEIKGHYGEGLPVTRITPSGKHDFGIKLGSYPPTQLGADRFINLLPAIQLPYQGQDMMIIDAGTATTVDWLTKDGQYLGGVILPGPEVLATSLQQATARLPRALPVWCDDFPGVSTQACIQAGLSTGLVGMLAAIIQRPPTQVAFDKNAPIIVTGGHGQTVQALFDEAGNSLYQRMVLKPQWTMTGLWQAWKHTIQLVSPVAGVSIAGDN